MGKSTHRPIILIHVDVDGLWAIKAAYGLAHERDPAGDPVILAGLERFSRLFSEYGISATFFVCGRDCQSAAHAAIIQRLSREGHEIASHSWSHRIGLAERGPERIREELVESARIIQEVAGIRPVGFRTPGFGVSSELAKALVETGYQYDSSVLPSSLGGFMRRVSKWMGESQGDGSEGRYGSSASAGALPEPYRMDIARPLQCGDGPLVEFPVAVTPRLKWPVHASVAIAAGRLYAGSALRRTLLRRQVVTYLFHAIDLVGGEECSGLPGGFWGRRLFAHSREKKTVFVRRILDIITKTGKVAPTRDWLDAAGL